METLQPQLIYEQERNKPMPDKFHAFIQQQLLFLIKLAYRDQFEVLPELNILFGEEKNVPDLALFEKGQLDLTHNETNISEIPVGAIEILSGQQPIQELVIKLERYLNAGVKSYWLVVPDLRSIYVYHHRNDSNIFGSNDVLIDEVLGIELELQEVFGALERKG